MDFAKISNYTIEIYFVLFYFDQRLYIGLKVHSLNCVFFKYRLKSSVFVVIYGVDDCGK
jgi:hypothetical protein